MKNPPAGLQVVALYLTGVGFFFLLLTVACLHSAGCGGNADLLAPAMAVLGAGCLALAWRVWVESPLGEWAATVLLAVFAVAAVVCAPAVYDRSVRYGFFLDADLVRFVLFAGGAFAGLAVLAARRFRGVGWKSP